MKEVNRLRVLQGYMDGKIEILSSHDLMDEIRRGLAALRKGSKIYTLEELFD
jgi:hypothetical protein